MRPRWRCSCAALLVVLALCARAQLSLYEPSFADSNSSNPEWLAPDTVDLGSSIVHEAVDLSEAQEQALPHEDAKSLEDVLHWAIQHSDPEKLRQQAEEVHTSNAVQDLLQTRRRVQELHEYLKHQPSEAELLKEAIGVVKAPDSSQELQLLALSRLQELVEPIDNANDLKTLDAITPLVALISPAAAPELSAAACYVVGTAASNNPTFQTHLTEAHPDIFDLLLPLVRAASGDSASKCLYCVSGLVRNTAPIRASFLAAGGLEVVAGVTASPTGEPRLKRKALDLLADLAQLEPGAVSALVQSSHSGPALIQALLSLLLQQDDLDTQEKGLVVLRNLAAMHAARPLLAQHGAPAVLGALCGRLAEQASEEQYMQYVSDLCRAVFDLVKGEERLEL